MRTYVAVAGEFLVDVFEGREEPVAWTDGGRGGGVEGPFGGFEVRALREVSGCRGGRLGLMYRDEVEEVVVGVVGVVDFCRGGGWEE